MPKRKQETETSIEPISAKRCTSCQSRRPQEEFYADTLQVCRPCWDKYLLEQHPHNQRAA